MLANIVIVYVVGVSEIEMFGQSTPAQKLSTTTCWT